MNTKMRLIGFTMLLIITSGKKLKKRKNLPLELRQI